MTGSPNDVSDHYSRDTLGPCLAAIGTLFCVGQPLLSVSTDILDLPVFRSVTLGWIYTFAQFAVAPVLLHVYLAHRNRIEARGAVFLMRDP